jgi:GntR family transcriptional regulator
MDPRESRRSRTLSPLLGSASPVLYKEVARQMRVALQRGDWQPGEALPSEADLATRFEVSVGTLRKALAELAAEGLVVRHQGRGTFVSMHNASREFHFFRIVPRQGEKQRPEVELRSFRRETPGTAIRDRLRLAPGDQVLCIENLLHLGGKPVVLDEIVISASCFPDLEKRRFRDRPGTIYGLYQERYGINVVRTVERLAAESAEPAIADALGVPPGTALLVIERVAYTFDDRPVELRTRRVHTANYVYLSDLDGPGRAVVAG